jgi:hypothetical protein
VPPAAASVRARTVSAVSSCSVMAGSSAVIERRILFFSAAADREIARQRRICASRNIEITGAH